MVIELEISNCQIIEGMYCSIFSDPTSIQFYFICFKGIFVKCLVFQAFWGSNYGEWLLLVLASRVSRGDEGPDQAEIWQKKMPHSG